LTQGKRVDSTNSSVYTKGTTRSQRLSLFLRRSSLRETPRTPDINSLSLSPKAGVCGPSGPKAHSTRTASSPRQPASSTRPRTPTDPHRSPPVMDTILHVILTLNPTDSHPPWTLLHYINTHIFFNLHLFIAYFLYMYMYICKCICIYVNVNVKCKYIFFIYCISFAFFEVFRISMLLLSV